MQELVFSPRHSGDPGHPHYMWASNKKNCIEGLGSGGHRNQEIVIEYKLGGMGIKKLVLKDKFAGKENNNLLLKA